MWKGFNLSFRFHRLELNKYWSHTSASADRLSINVRNECSFLEQYSVLELFRLVSVDG